MTTNEKNEILKGALEFLNVTEFKQLQLLLERVDETSKQSKTNTELLQLFETAKKVEGCSLTSLKYYLYILNTFLNKTTKLLNEITTDDIRNYLEAYSTTSISKVSMDNIRRVLSSFFAWLEEEDYIRKNPVKRIHKIKSLKIIKQAYSDENVENLKDNCSCLRDKVIIELLSSTGMRVGELVKLNINNIDFENKECIVLGKGGKQRKVYFDSKTKLHLQHYLDSRIDNDNALFVSMLKPFKRLQISGIEIMLRKLGFRTCIENVHPHRFRRTLATKAIDKGMPVEQVQILLGHTKIDTTMHYAIVDQTNVKNSYRRYIG
ncbi:MAG: tyrosine-type recombinase/integrase [Clostridia bacterium]|nr:tyrosine-type recombinase/integrase [Clostridia bacterium]